MLVRVCDRCKKLVENGDYIELEYRKHLDGHLLGSRISVTLCEDCFEQEYGEGHLEALINNYQMDKIKQEAEEYIGG